MTVERDDLISILQTMEQRLNVQLQTTTDRITGAMNAALMEQERRNSTFATRDAVEAIAREVQALRTAGLERAFGIVAAILGVMLAIVITYVVLRGH